MRLVSGTDYVYNLPSGLEPYSSLLCELRETLK
jgi:hypothetical protein